MRRWPWRWWTCRASSWARTEICPHGNAHGGPMNPERHITIVGAGPGSLDYLTPAGRRAVERAEVLVGANRLLDLFPDLSAERVPVGADVERALEAIAACGRRRVAVLVTGDPGM